MGLVWDFLSQAVFDGTCRFFASASFKRWSHPLLRNAGMLSGLPTQGGAPGGRLPPVICGIGVHDRPERAGCASLVQAERPPDAGGSPGGRVSHARDFGSSLAAMGRPRQRSGVPASPGPAAGVGLRSNTTMVRYCVTAKIAPDRKAVGQKWTGTWEGFFIKQMLPSHPRGYGI